jgi:hypothetical protein
VCDNGTPEKKIDCKAPHRNISRDLASSLSFIKYEYFTAINRVKLEFVRTQVPETVSACPYGTSTPRDGDRAL